MAQCSNQSLVIAARLGNSHYSVIIVRGKRGLEDNELLLASLARRSYSTAATPCGDGHLIGATSREEIG